MRAKIYRRVVRWARRRFDRRGLILLYHSVASPQSDPWRLAISPEQFAEHLNVLRRFGQPIRLQDLVQGLRDRNLSSRPIAVTFDDGYANNLVEGKALLTRYDIPATVFVATGSVGGANESWWDELDRLLLMPGDLPANLSLRIGGSHREWQLSEARHYTLEQAVACRTWRAWEPAPTARHQLYLDLYHLLFLAKDEERRASLQELARWSGAGRLPRPSHRTLTAEEIVSLADGGLVEVGAHSVTHSSLAGLTSGSQAREIRESKQRLEEILAAPVRSFAYPFGRAQDFSSTTAALVREAGFDSACTTVGQPVDLGCDRYQMPRYTVPASDGETFERWLATTVGA